MICYFEKSLKPEIGKVSNCFHQPWKFGNFVENWNDERSDTFFLQMSQKSLPIKTSFESVSHKYVVIWDSSGKLISLDDKGLGKSMSKEQKQWQLFCYLLKTKVDRFWASVVTNE